MDWIIGHDKLIDHQFSQFKQNAPSTTIDMFAVGDVSSSVECDMS
jgi:hypothetical protein